MSTPKGFSLSLAPSLKNATFPEIKTQAPPPPCLILPQWLFEGSYSGNKNSYRVGLFFRRQSKKGGNMVWVEINWVGRSALGNIAIPLLIWHYLIGIKIGARLQALWWDLTTYKIIAIFRMRRAMYYKALPPHIGGTLVVHFQENFLVHLQFISGTLVVHSSSPKPRQN